MAQRRPGFEWATFRDKRFTVENADIFWSGALIHRVNYLGAAVAGVIDDRDGGSRFRPYVDGVPYRVQD